MRPILILFFLLLFPLTQLSARSYFMLSSIGGKTVAYYNSDSILHLMPDYKKAVDSMAYVEKLLDYQDSMLNIRYFNQIIELQENCLKWSPYILSIHKKAIADLYQNILDYRVEVKLDLDNMYKNLIPPIIDKITAAAKQVSAEEDYLALLDSNSIVSFSPKVKVVNISGDVCKQLGIK